MTWIVEVPSGVKTGRATLVTEQRGSVRVRIRDLWVAFGCAMVWVGLG